MHNRMRLVFVQQDVDFRKSDESILDACLKEEGKNLPALRPNDVLMFVSKSGNQILFILNFGELDTYTGYIRRFIDTRRWRLCGGGRWNPLMIKNYGLEVGIDFVNLRKYDEIIEEKIRARTGGNVIKLRKRHAA